MARLNRSVWVVDRQLHRRIDIAFLLLTPYVPAESSIPVRDAIFQVTHSALCNSEILGFIECPQSSSTLIQELIARLLSVNDSNAPVWRPASALQLALNFFDVRYVTSSDGDSTGDD